MAHHPRYSLDHGLPASPAVVVTAVNPRPGLVQGPGRGREQEPVGPDADFGEFYRSQWRAVLSLAFVLSGTWPAGEELTQDAFTEAWRHWGRVGSYDNPGAWVRRVVATRAVSRARRLATEAKTLLRLRSTTDTHAGELEAPDTALWAAVRSLPRRQAQVMALRYLADYAVTDVATVLGLTEGAVKTHLHRARRTLAAGLNTEHRTMGSPGPAEPAPGPIPGDAARVDAHVQAGKDEA